MDRPNEAECAPRAPPGCASGAAPPCAKARDPEPVAPVEPGLSDCCGSGCSPCIFELYQDALDRYRVEIEQWHARQPDRQIAR